MEKIASDFFNGMIGKGLFIRTVTYHSVGTVVCYKGGFLELSDASWVANSGRFMDTIKNGEIQESEPVGKMWISVDSIVDMFPFEHKLPTKQLPES